MTRNIDTALLRAFSAVAETAGMTKAGRLLSLTQAAVSQQVKRLEDLFETRLFERDRRGLRLTPAGERLLPHAQGMLARNDEIWGLMTSPHFEGEVRLGVPHDIVKPFMPPILKSFNRAWSRVRVAIVCGSTPMLREALERGELDLTLTTERECGEAGETLMTDDLVWVGAEHGRAHDREPLPVALADSTCVFRQAATDALSRDRRDWRTVCEDRSMTALHAVLEADLSVAPMLVSTIPESLEPLGPDSGLPNLPRFYINLYLPPAGASEVAVELAQYIREQFTARYERAA